MRRTSPPLGRPLGLLLGLLLLVGLLGAVWSLADGPPWARRAQDTGPRSVSVAPEEPEATAPVLRGAEDVGPALGDGTEEPWPPPLDPSTLDAVRDLHGVVVRADGRAVGGASVSSSYRPWRDVDVPLAGRWDEREPGPSTRTAGDGSFRLRLAAGDVVDLEVSRPGFRTVLLARVQAGERVRVVLDVGVALVVDVVDEEEAPVANARVRLFRMGRPRELVEAGAETGPDGSLRFDGLPPATTVTIDAKHEVLGSPMWIDVPLPASGETRRRVVLPRGRTITGRVTDAATGDPIAGARIALGWFAHKEVRTDEDGRYALPGYSAMGIYEVHASAPGHAPEEAVVGDRDRIDFALRPGAVVVGRVLDVAGEPLGGAVVTAVASRFDGRQQIVSTGATVTDAGGRFRLEDLRPEMPFTLLVVSRGHARHVLDFDLDPEGQATDLGDLRLRPPRSLVVRVRGPGGAPLPETFVTLSGSNADRTRLREAAQGTYAVERLRWTDDRGEVRFADLAPGDYEVRVQAAGAAVHEATAVVPAEGAVPPCEVRLDWSHEIRVRVRDEEGRPVGGVYVYADEAGERASRDHTEADGRAVLRVSALPVEVQARMYLDELSPVRYLDPEPVPVDGDRREVEIVLRTAAVVAGVVVGEDGKPLARARIRAERDGEMSGSDSSDAEGRFEVEFPPGGPVDVVLEGTVMTETWDWSPEEVVGELRRVAPGSKGLRLTARPAPADRRVRVRVVDLGGAAVPDAEVVLDPGRTGLSRSARTDASGVVEFEGLTARARAIQASADGREGNLFPVAPAGQEVVVRLVP